MEKAPHWQTSWDAVSELAPLAPNTFFARILDSFPEVARGQQSAIEVGCFPGQFIDYMGGKGYQVSGFDTYERVVVLNEWLAARGRDVGGFQCKSLDAYLAENPTVMFDAVISLGFIEHFVDFCDVLDKHAQLCRPGGAVLIGTPNFATPIQRALHETLDKTNLQGHVLDTMYPKIWALYLTAIGFDVKHAGPVGRFSFWTDTKTDDGKIRLLQSNLPGALPVLQALGDGFNQREAGYAVVLAVKSARAPVDQEAKAALAAQCRDLAQEISGRDQELSEPMAAMVRKLMT